MSEKELLKAAQHVLKAIEYDRSGSEPDYRMEVKRAYQIIANHDFVEEVELNGSNKDK